MPFEENEDEIETVRIARDRCDGDRKQRKKGTKSIWLKHREMDERRETRGLKSR